MSSNPDSVIVYKGLRCTKVPRVAVAAAALPTPTASEDSSPLHLSLSNTTPTLVVDDDHDHDHDNDNDNILATSTANTLSPDDSRPGDSTVSTTTRARKVASASMTDSEPNPHATGLVEDQTSRSSHSGVPPGVSPGLLSPTSLQTQTSGAPFPISPSSTTGAASVGNGSSQDPANESSHREHRSTSQKTILGSVFGSLAFLAVILVICLLVIRRRRRKSRNNANDQLLQSARGSADSSHHQYQSPMSQRSETPQFGIPQRIPHDRSSSINNPFANPPPPAQSPQAIENPFLSPDDPPDADPPMIHIQSATPAPRSESQTERERTLFRTVPYDPAANTSQQSLGSTIILPGRNSVGSSLHEKEDDGYPATPSVSDLSPSKFHDPGRTSTRSDPFDLEIPRNMRG